MKSSLSFHLFHSLVAFVILIHSCCKNAIVHAYPSVIVESTRPKCMKTPIADGQTVVVTVKSADIDAGGTLQFTTTDPVDYFDDDDDDDYGQEQRFLYEKIPVDKEVIEFNYSSDEDFVFHLCMYVKYAQEAKVRASVKMDMMDTEEFEKMQAKKKGLSPKETQEQERSQERAKSHMRTMEATFQHLGITAAKLVKDAHSLKAQEGGFHHLTQKLHKSVKWFKIFQIGIVSVAGVIQANHVLSTLRKRHVI